MQESVAEVNTNVGVAAAMFASFAVPLLTEEVHHR
jgi:hypothetical protein